MNEIDGGADDALAALKARADALEKQLHEAERNATLRLRHAELKTEATRAGIVDIDGLRLLDPAAVETAGEGAFSAADLVARLRRDKPWLFAVGNTSSVLAAPPVAVTKKRLATEMSVEEWRSARAELLRRR